MPNLTETRDRTGNDGPKENAGLTERHVLMEKDGRMDALRGTCHADPMPRGVTAAGS